MGYRTKATDWEIASIGAIAGGAGVAAGWFFFYFKSKSANVSLCCRFVGIGIGAGADLGRIGKSLKLVKHAPKLENLFKVAAYGAASPFISFDRVQVRNPFSMHELHNNFGSLSLAGVSAGVGYTKTYATCASGLFSRYFVNQPCHGWGVGFGASAMHTYGFWFNSGG